VQRLHAAEPAAVVEVGGCDVFQVPARAEMPARSGEYHGTDGLIVLNVLQGHRQLVAHGGLECVAFAGAVKGDGRDLVGHIKLQQRGGAFGGDDHERLPE
jgi:hypothetical protein